MCGAEAEARAEAEGGGGEGSRFVRMQVGTRMGARAEAEVVAEAETVAEGKAEAKEAKARVESALCGPVIADSVNKELLVLSNLELIKTQFNRFNRTSGVFLSNVDAAGTGYRNLQLAH
jgi:hypothetical protein